MNEGKNNHLKSSTFSFQFQSLKFPVSLLQKNAVTPPQKSSVFSLLSLTLCCVFTAGRVNSPSSNSSLRRPRLVCGSEFSSWDVQMNSPSNTTSGYRPWKMSLDFKAKQNLWEICQACSAGRGESRRKGKKKKRNEKENLVFYFLDFKGASPPPSEGSAAFDPTPLIRSFFQPRSFTHQGFDQHCRPSTVFAKTTAEL